MSQRTDFGRSSLSSDLGRAVMDLIEQQELVVGDSLESLKLLAERFGVAVPTLREAMRQLEGLGVVEFRHGSGIYVGVNAGRRVFSNPLTPRADRVELAELLQARGTIEPDIAYMAAQVRDAHGIAELESILAAAHAAVLADDPDLWRINFDLHTAIAQATGNRIIIELMNSLTSLYGAQQREILIIHGAPMEDYREHEAIVAAIVAGDADLARTLVREHLADVTDVIIANNDAPTPASK